MDNEPKGVSVLTAAGEDNYPTANVWNVIDARLYVGNADGDLAVYAPGHWLRAQTHSAAS